MLLFCQKISNLNVFTVKVSDAEQHMHVRQDIDTQDIVDVTQIASYSIESMPNPSCEFKVGDKLVYRVDINVMHSPMNIACVCSTFEDAQRMVNLISHVSEDYIEDNVLIETIAGFVDIELVKWL